jgi:hypothetical protein
MRRRLTVAERAAAAEVFGPGLDCSAVVVREGRILGAGGIARTLPWAIHFPPGASATEAFLPWLMHEHTHCWQSHHGARHPTTAATAVLCWAGLRSYDYGGAAGLARATAAARGLRSFNTEQQGDIVRDYYRAATAGLSTEVYAPFIAELRAPPR